MRRSLLAGVAVTHFALIALVGGCTINSTNTVADGGADGGATTDAGAADSAPQGDGGASLLGFTPSNIDLSGLDLSAVGDIDITAKCSFNSETNEQLCGDGTKLAFKTVTQPNNIKVGVYVARSFRVEPNVVVSIVGNSPIVFVALDKIEVLGGIVGAGTGEAAVAGGYPPPTGDNTNGAGPGGGIAGSTVSAAGGGTYCGVGGSGAVETGPTTGSAGGAVYGTAEITPLVGGSSGGTGTAGGGGAGGGAIQLVAKNSISIPSGGYLHVGGGGGTFGGAASGQEASGGGSGGAILIESSTVSVAGVLAANGGGGGEGAMGNTGADATATDQPALGGDDATRGSAGGNGSAGANAKGTDGAVKAGSTAGGGGGGAGRIRINTKSGAATLTGVTLSPAASTTCATQGTVKP